MNVEVWIARLRALEVQWRKDARADALYAARQSKVKQGVPCKHCLSAATALAKAECADDLAAVLSHGAQEDAEDAEDRQEAAEFSRAYHAGEVTLVSYVAQGAPQEDAELQKVTLRPLVDVTKSGAEASRPPEPQEAEPLDADAATLTPWDKLTVEPMIGSATGQMTLGMLRVRSDGGGQEHYTDDPSEAADVAEAHADRLQALAAHWSAWASATRGSGEIRLQPVCDVDRLAALSPVSGLQTPRRACFACSLKAGVVDTGPHVTHLLDEPCPEAAENAEGSPGNPASMRHRQRADALEAALIPFMDEQQLEEKDAQIAALRAALEKIQYYAEDLRSRTWLAPVSAAEMNARDRWLADEFDAIADSALLTGLRQ